MIRVKDKGERKMSNKNLIVNTPDQSLVYWSEEISLLLR